MSSSIAKKTWIKNPNAFFHIKGNEIIFLSNLGEGCYLTGNEKFISFWNLFISAADENDLQNAFKKSENILKEMIAHQLIIPSKDSAKALPEIKLSGLQLKVTPFPSEFALFASAGISQGFGPSDY